MNNLSGSLSFHGNVSGQMGANLLPSVEANPSGTATEILTSIRVGDIIYSIPSGGGGGGGTNDYESLLNKPKINNVILSGELTLNELNIQPKISFPMDNTKYLDGEGNFTTPQSTSSFSQSLLYDSGSTTEGAPFNQDLDFLDNLSNYDAIIIEWNTYEDRVRESPLETSDTVFCTVQDALSNNFCLHFSGYDTRWGEVTFTDTTFNFFARGGDLTPQIYKIIGLKF